MKIRANCTVKLTNGNCNFDITMPKGQDYEKALSLLAMFLVNSEDGVAKLQALTEKVIGDKLWTNP
jgi:hypothetical protein